MVFLLISVAAIIIFLLISNNLVKNLAEQERARMEVWAEATKRLAQQDAATDIEFLFSIIENNNTIPVMIADGEGNIMEYRNYNLPDAGRSKMMFAELSERDSRYLHKRLFAACRGKDRKSVV